MDSPWTWRPKPWLFSQRLPSAAPRVALPKWIPSSLFIRQTFPRRIGAVPWSTMAMPSFAFRSQTFFSAVPPPPIP